MLLELRIENFGIVENGRFRPGQGLNTITGETGAGKSLLLQALQITLGAKATTGFIRNGSSRAVVEAEFEVDSEVCQLLDNNSIPVSDRMVTLRREIYLSGRPRSLINGVSVNAPLMKTIGSMLAEIHGQHDHQRLLDPANHLDFLDIYAGTEELRNQVSKMYHRLAEIRKRLRSVSMEEEEKQQRLDFLRYAIDEIEDLEPEEGEFESLTNEKALIQNSGKVFQDLAEAYSLLYEDDRSILTGLEQVDRLLERHSDLFQSATESYEEKQSLVKQSMYQIEAVVDFLREQRQRLQFSPERLEDVEERLQSYRRLLKKYGGTTTLVLQKRDSFLRELASIEMSEEEAALLRSELSITESELQDLATELSMRRRSVVPSLEEKLSTELNGLGMAGARIQISVSREYATESTERFIVNEKGLDIIEFFFNANEGEVVQPLRKIASGGELSRITLALKSVILDRSAPATMIFDEVDTGVGGEVAYTIGQRLKELSERSQVIVITHLHQIASLGRYHFKIQKETHNSRTYSKIERLNGQERLKEMARMLGSTDPAVIQHVKGLLSAVEV
ncbi:MAG: DNA repair protein RecN [Leptonema sp. (in: Bacteria)]|nr:DNA repair protein RecN [Leptonema sp. (in: bacteria)]